MEVCPFGHAFYFGCYHKIDQPLRYAHVNMRNRYLSKGPVHFGLDKKKF